MNEAGILDVTSLNLYIKNKFEDDLSLQRVYIRGEISNLNKHYTGHYYFSLKDENSKISCTMFSSYVNKLKHPINNGDEVLIYGKVSVYDKLGTYQIYAYNVEPYGLGKYLLELEALKKKLQEEGLFDLPKKEINRFPKKIGVVTSKSGAAVQDIIHTIKLRWPCEIEVFPCLVQGEEAPRSMIKCLKQADESDVDTIILARGGGANEDLKAFNDEGLIRTAAALKKPLITAIGHQIDTSLVDLVSDAYAITPTEAGERATSNKNELISQIINQKELAKRVIESKITRKQNALLQYIQVIETYNPITKLTNYVHEVNSIREKLEFNVKFKLKNYQVALNELKNKVEYLDTRLRLKDGKIIAYSSKKEKIDHVDKVKVGDELDLYLSGGKLNVEVKEVVKDGK